MSTWSGYTKFIDMRGRLCSVNTKKWGQSSQDLLHGILSAFVWVDWGTDKKPHESWCPG